MDCDKPVYLNISSNNTTQNFTKSDCLNLNSSNRNHWGYLDQVGLSEPESIDGERAFIVDQGGKSSR